MLTQEQVELIQLTTDHNAKLVLLCVIALYCAFSFWKLKRFEITTLSSRLYYIALFIYSRVTLFFFPLMVVSFLHINTTLEEMIIVVSGFYGIIFVSTFGFLIILGFEKVLDLLGINKGGMYK